MTTPILDVQHVSKTFGRRGAIFSAAPSVAAVADVSLSIGRGEIVALVGESGAGKTTMSRIILGLERPDTGKVLLDGVNLVGLSEAQLRRQRRLMHLVFQDPYESLHPGLRVGQAVAEPLVIAGRDGKLRESLIAGALEEVGLAPAARFVRRFPHELSGGQRQRVALARALVARPKLVIADEPTSMLDVSLRAGVLDLLNTLRSDHDIAVLLITHDLAVARYLSDRIGVMRAGHLVELGPTEEVIHRPSHEYTRSLLAAIAGD